MSLCLGIQAIPHFRSELPVRLDADYYCIIQDIHKMKRTLLVGTTLLLCTVAQAGELVADSLSTKTLEEVAVIGTRASARTPMSYSNLNKASLQRENLGVDLPYLLQMQPSVVATSEAGAGIGYTALRVRGVDATGINITLGGVPINDSESQAVFWVNMPDLASSLQEVQIQRGVGTSSNGVASFGATINMTTDHLAQKSYAELGLSGGSFGTLRRNIRLGSGRINGKWAVDARLSQITSNGYVDRSGVDLASYFVQGGYFGEKTLVKFISFGGKEVTGIAWNGLKPSNGTKYGRTYNSAGDMGIEVDGARQYYRNTDNYKQIHNHLVITHKFTPELALNITGHHTHGFGYTDEYRTGRKLVEYGMANYKNSSGETVKRTDLIRRKYLDNDFYGVVSSLTYDTKKWSINLGVSANRYEGAHYGEVRWTKDYPQPVYPETRYYDNVGRKLTLSTYAKVNYQISSALSAFVDLQYRHVGYYIDGKTDNYDSANGKMQQLNLKKPFNFFNPKAGLFYQLDERNHAYASVAVSNREPNRNGFTSATNGNYPRHERLVDYELGYAYKSRVFSLSANTYYMKYTDQLVMNGRQNDVGAMELENVQDSYRLGVELQTAIRPVEWLRLDGALALSKNKIKSYDFYFAKYDTHWKFDQVVKHTYSNTTIAYSPSVVASGALTFVHSGFEASLRSQYVSKQYLDNTQSEERALPAYHAMGATLAYDLPIRGLKRWNVNLQINNLLNTAYDSNAYVYDAGIDAGGKVYNDLRYFPQAGINFLVGTTLTF